MSNASKVLESIRLQDVLESLCAAAGYAEEARPGTSMLPWYGTSERHYTDFQLTGDSGPEPDDEDEDGEVPMTPGFLDDIEDYDWDPEVADEEDTNAPTEAV